MEEEEKMPGLWTANYVKVWSANFMIFFSFMLIMPLLPLYMTERFHTDKDTIGLVLGAYTFTAMLIRPFGGFFSDSFDRKKVLLISYGLFAIFFGGYIGASTLLLFAIVRILHGAPFGATTVANSTMAIDVLHPKRRAEGIGYYGLSNNLATAMAPSIGLFLYDLTSDFTILFWISLAIACTGFAINCTVKSRKRETISVQKISLDRFILLKGWREAIVMACLAFSYGVISTYLAIYGKEELGITTGTGIFFALLSLGLILSRLTGSRGLRKGQVIENATHGVIVSLAGYLLFAAVHNSFGYYGAALIIGLGNGHMFPAFQNMFINLAPNSQRGTANSTLLTAWDVGVGTGVLAGGLIAEYLSYGASFWMAWAINLLGVAIFFLSARAHYIKYKLR